MSRHVNIPVFIPHLGCPNQCVFCNQRHISGVRHFDPDSVKDIIDNALSTVEDDAFCEIAFFGGSFTGIERSLMIRLLEITRPYVSSGRVCSIRCSTRPDYISDDILDILEDYHVKVIELGLQSMDDGVLLSSKRGHTKDDAIRACRMIKERGFTLGGQMMIGLPGSSAATEVETAKAILAMGADVARIYPTVVFHDTELCMLAKEGNYIPLSIDEAVERSVEPLRILIEGGVGVIRIGLCSSDELSSDDCYFAGPNHPALGEMIINRLYLTRILSELSGRDTKGKELIIGVSRGFLSKAIGNKKINKTTLISRLGLKKISFYESSELNAYEFKLELKGEN